MVEKAEFITGKNKALSSLAKACENNEVDEAILPLLRRINKLSSYYTTSSCYGRIVLLEIPTIGDKKQAVFLGKWHRTIEVDDVLLAAEKASHGLLWILAQSPILHLVTDTVENADTMVKTALECGFKNSGVRSLRKKIVIELCSTERLDAPIGREGKLFCQGEYLDLLVDISNDVFLKSKEKLSRLIDAIVENY